MKPIKYTWLAVLAIMMLLVSACGTEATATPPAAPATSPPAAATNPPAAADTATPAAMTGGMAKVTGTLTVWESYGSSHGSAESDAWTKALAQFKKDNPDANVTALDV